MASGHPNRRYGQGVIDVPPVIRWKLTVLFEIFLYRAHEDVSQQRAKGRAHSDSIRLFVINHRQTGKAGVFFVAARRRSIQFVLDRCKPCVSLNQSWAKVTSV